eukprot:TRINITY_DN5727_c0_g1_i4.p1 TRINITY_DN5727_c0_g1~~TRINITY_DN5727_c0_g1_i4.p1  ORF type:complete len:3119 (+),score=519.31 TRINITY_DN5727_c0_g1_i4:111-9467(+)
MRRRRRRRLLVALYAAGSWGCHYDPVVKTQDCSGGRFAYSPTACPDGTNSRKLYGGRASGTLSGTSGSLTFPSSGSYVSNENLCWRILCEGGSVGITFSSFSTESSFDKVYLFAADGTNSEYSGTTVPGAYTAPVAGDVVVRFSSDGSINSLGFSLSWTCSWTQDCRHMFLPSTACAAGTPAPAGCPASYGDVNGCGIRTLAESGVIEFPCYPQWTAYWANDEHCWRIKNCGVGGVLQLTFDWLDTETSYDEVSIYGAGSTMHGPYSGDYSASTPPSIPAITTSDAVVHWVSDGSAQAMGWTISWTCTALPTASPTQPPTVPPTKNPTLSPIPPPTRSPTASPTRAPTAAPTAAPTQSPEHPTGSPTTAPTAAPTTAPTLSPLHPTDSPTTPPTTAPSAAPSLSPLHPTDSPTAVPTTAPSAAPSQSPLPPTAVPTSAPSAAPSVSPTLDPTASPSTSPTASPTSAAPSASPTTAPSAAPTASPSTAPSAPPSASPTTAPTAVPSAAPTAVPSASPSTAPTASPSASPTSRPSSSPTAAPTAEPTSAAPTTAPTVSPSVAPSGGPSLSPSASPSAPPTAAPSPVPTESPTSRPTHSPSTPPSTSPTTAPTAVPTVAPSTAPSAAPTHGPTFSPTAAPTHQPTSRPSVSPTTAPTTSPTTAPTGSPTTAPTVHPTGRPSRHPSANPTAAPSTAPTAAPTAEPTVSPTVSPTTAPTTAPSTSPTTSPTVSPSTSPTFAPSASPTVSPTVSPTTAPSASPTQHPTTAPSVSPSAAPSVSPTAAPSLSPTVQPTGSPTTAPTTAPTVSPSTAPTVSPSPSPSVSPTPLPTTAPTVAPSTSPTLAPSVSPSTAAPSVSPTLGPTVTPPCPCVHGACVQLSCCPWRCVCEARWGGEHCDDCSEGWWGPDCTRPCAGGACTPCLGHGACDNGLSGTGTCTCNQSAAAGWWAGVDCGTCSAGWGGADCKKPCPDCGATGECDQQTATCTCLAPGSDPASSPPCSGCLPLYKPDAGSCVSTCPGAVPGNGEHCSGHGRCAGTACTCAAGWYGAGCSSQCPCARGAPCDAAGLCACPQGTEPPDCSACVTGKWGLDCERDCQCNGRADRCAANTGACLCAEQGWWRGAACELRCPGDAAVCSGHGTCSAGGGQAVCGCALGWAGAACGECAAGWVGPACAVQCNGGAGCGPGECLPSGQCYCTRAASGAAADTCGPGCATVGSACGYCSKPTLWGPSCDRECPAGCAAHGRCADGKYGDGQCSCVSGWGGVACDKQCPVSGGAACGGVSHGACDSATGRCRCAAGWGGPACTNTCPRPGGESCSGKGRCLGDPPECLCDTGWGGSACASPCNCLHGTCLENGGCECLPAWTGALCDSCVSGLSGPDCADICQPPNGTTASQGTDCVCADKRSGPGCSSVCPTDNSSVECGGRGQCIWGTGLPQSTCNCQPGWFGRACTVPCDPLECSAQHGLLRAQCSKATGACECQYNQSGYYAGAQCDGCDPHHWGPACERTCDCANGDCNAIDGSCACYGDKTRGFWAGRRCDVCLSGYTGGSCVQRESPMTRVDQRGDGAAPAAAPRMAVCDNASSTVHVSAPAGAGGTRALKGSPPGADGADTDLGGEAQAAWRAGGAVYVAAGGGLWVLDSGAPPQRLGAVLPAAGVVAGCSDTDGNAIVLGADCTSTELTPQGASTPGAPVAGLAACPVACCSSGATAVACGPTAAGSWACASLSAGGAAAPVAPAPSDLWEGASPAACAVSTVAQQLLVLLAGPNASVALLPLPAADPNATQPERLDPMLIDRNPVPPGPAAIAAHPSEPVAYCFWQQRAGEPSRGAKLRITASGGLYGQARLGRLAYSSGHSPEVVGAACVSEDFVVAATSGSGNGFAAYLSFEAVEATPALADSRGGTEIGLIGIGYTGSAAVCRFAEGGEQVTGRVRSAHLSVCTAPPVPEPLCAGALVALALGAGGSTPSRSARAAAAGAAVFAEGTAWLQRYRPPRLLRATPLSWAASASTVVQVQAEGLRQSDALTCVFHTAGVRPRLYHGSSVRGLGSVALLGCRDLSCRVLVSPATTAVHVPGRFAAGGGVECVQPEFRFLSAASQSPPPKFAYLDIALDGQIYTDAPVAHAVITDPARLRLPSRHEATIGRPEEEAAWRVLVVDAANAALGSWDTENRTVMLCATHAAEGPDAQCHAQVDVPMVNGAAVLPSALTLPVVLGAAGSESGVIGFTLMAVALPGGWHETSEVIVHHGTPAQLVVATQPEETTSGAVALAPQPRLWVADERGNRCIDSDTLLVLAEVLPPVVPRQSPYLFQTYAHQGLAVFHDVVVEPLFGVQYYLLFTANLTATPPLSVSVISRNITAALCPEDQYQKLGTRQCERCPSEGAVCNGSSVVTAKNGFWQPGTNSTRIYRCISRDVCLSAAAQTQSDKCAAGSGGALCEGCQEGYARARASREPCTQCGGAGETVKALAVAFAMMLFASVIVAVCSLEVMKTGSASHVIIVIRSAVLFMQVLGKLNEYHAPLGEPLHSTLFLFSRMSLVDFSLFQPFCCMIRSYFPFLEIYTLWLPGIATVIAAALFIATSGARKANFGRLGDRMKAGALMLKGGLPFGILFLTACCGSFFLAYATMLTHLLAYQKCNEYDTGRGTKEWKLWVDMSIDCDGDQYQKRKAGAIAAVWILGLGVPLIFLATRKLWMRYRSGAGFIFLTGGFRSSRWFWSFVMMARSAGMVAPVVWATSWSDHRLQHYLGLWTLQCALVLQLWQRPFERPLHNRLEAYLLGGTCVLMQLSLLFFVDAFSDSPRSLLGLLLVVGVWGLLLKCVYHVVPRPWRAWFRKNVLRRRQPPPEQLLNLSVSVPPGSGPLAEITECPDEEEGLAASLRRKSTRLSRRQSRLLGRAPSRRRGLHSPRQPPRAPSSGLLLTMESSLDMDSSARQSFSSPPVRRRSTRTGLQLSMLREGCEVTDAISEAEDDDDDGPTDVVAQSLYRDRPVTPHSSTLGRQNTRQRRVRRAPPERQSPPQPGTQDAVPPSPTGGMVPDKRSGSLQWYSPKGLGRAMVGARSFHTSRGTPRGTPRSPAARYTSFDDSSRAIVSPSSAPQAGRGRREPTAGGAPPKKRSQLALSVAELRSG